MCTKYGFKERKVLVTHEHSARAIQGLIFFVRANHRFFTNERLTSIGIQSALMFTSIQTSGANTRDIPNFLLLPTFLWTLVYWFNATSILIYICDLTSTVNKAAHLYYIFSLVNHILWIMTLMFIDPFMIWKDLTYWFDL